MTKGRNTSVISVRLPDETVKLLKTLGRSRRQSMTELLRPVIDNFAASGRIASGRAHTDEALGAVSLKGPGNDRKLESERTPDRARESFPGMGRNDPCPCGSGKKYKKCHGA